MSEDAEAILEAERSASCWSVCEVCGRIFGDHAFVPGVLDYRGHPFLHRVCSGRVYKL